MALHSHQLTLAAEALDHYAGDPRDDARDGFNAQPYRIAAEDCRREVQAASGFANPATLALRIVVDNDRTMYDALTERARTIRTRSADLIDALANYVPTAYSSQADDARKLTVSYLADDLRDWFRDELRERVEAWANIGHDRTALGSNAAVSVVSAMAAHALAEVDWLGVADDVLHRADRTGEYAEAVQA